jgi:YggT family protein
MVPDQGWAMAENPFLWLIRELIWLYIWILIATAVLSWLIAFNVVNTRNDIVRSVANFLYAVTEPLLRPIRNLLPPMGGLDISMVFLMIGLFFLDKLIVWLFLQM